MKTTTQRSLALGTAVTFALTGSLSLLAAPPTQAAVQRCSSSTPHAERPVLRYADVGSCVRELQRRLNDHGAGLAVDGSFGPLTLAAVKHYQRSHDLLVDGIVGPITWGSLLNTPSEPPPPQEKCPRHPVTR